MYVESIAVLQQATRGQNITFKGLKIPLIVNKLLKNC